MSGLESPRVLGARCKSQAKPPGAKCEYKAQPPDKTTITVCRDPPKTEDPVKHLGPEWASPKKPTRASNCFAQETACASPDPQTPPRDPGRFVRRDEHGAIVFEFVSPPRTPGGTPNHYPFPPVRHELREQLLAIGFEETFDLPF